MLDETGCLLFSLWESNFTYHGRTYHQAFSFRDVNINALISQIELQASCDIYTLIKRCDEKYITEKSYENAKFVEDIVRDISKLLKKDNNITKYKILSENIESIHNHTAYAYIER